MRDVFETIFASPNLLLFCFLFGEVSALITAIFWDTIYLLDVWVRFATLAAHPLVYLHLLATLTAHPLISLVWVICEYQFLTRMITHTGGPFAGVVLLIPYEWFLSLSTGTRYVWIIGADARFRVVSHEGVVIFNMVVVVATRIDPSLLNHPRDF